MNRHDDRERGYVLFGIAIGLVILGIAMTSAVPLWQKVMQRERERELIFRGYQYMQAIELYQRKYPGAYPADMEVLVKEKFLRKLYTDPFSEDGDGEFRVLRQMSPELQQGGLEQQRAAGEAAGITGLNRSQARMRTPGGQSLSGSGRRAGGGFRSTLGRGASDAGMGGIVGVASASDEETFYKVPGKEKYKDWLFVYGAQQMGVLGQVGQGGAGQQVGPRWPGEGLHRDQAGKSDLAVSSGSRSGWTGRTGRDRLDGARPFGSGDDRKRFRAKAKVHASPFPGLPPPPGVHEFSFRRDSGVGVPGQPCARATSGSTRLWKYRSQRQGQLRRRARASPSADPAPNNGNRLSDSQRR